MPTVWQNALFHGKVRVLRAKRMVRDLADRLPCHPQSPDAFGFILAELRTPLYSDDAPAEREFELGKVQNLRVAARRLDGVVIPANTVFSFWRQVGRCSRRRGYVDGRQIQEGCLIPSVGGGLCLLSNALFAAAKQARLEIVERHPHTRIVPGSLAERGEDATVAWNHIDLRFRHSHPWRLAIHLTSTELIVRIEGSSSSGRIPLPLARHSATPTLDPDLHACGRCGQTSCGRFSTPSLLSTEPLTLALQIEPEFVAGEAWTLGNAPSGLGFARIQTRLAGRKAWARDGTRASAELARAEIWAQAVAQRIPYTTSRLRIDLRLLPWLWRSGVLGGREFEVLALRPSLRDLQARLDAAADRFPDPSTAA